MDVRITSSINRLDIVLDVVDEENDAEKSTEQKMSESLGEKWPDDMSGALIIKMTRGIKTAVVTITFI